MDKSREVERAQWIQNDYPQVTTKMWCNGENLYSMCTCLQLLWNSLRILTCCSWELSDLHQNAACWRSLSWKKMTSSHRRPSLLARPNFCTICSRLGGQPTLTTLSTSLWSTPFQRLMYTPSPECGHCTSSREFCVCHLMSFSHRGMHSSRVHFGAD